MKHLFTLLGGLLAAPAFAQLPAAVAVPPAPTSLAFRPNQGQWHPAARYVAEVPGGRLFLENGGLTYAFLRLDGPAHGHAAPAAKAATEAAPAPPRACALKVQFVGAAAQPEMAPAGPATGEVRNYFRGTDPAHWARRVPAFGRVRYGQVWPGIGVHFYENKQQKLEYDFELSAGADPARIALRYAGADKITLDGQGNLRLALPLGHLTELAPTAWQTDAAGRRRAVRCRYVLRQTEGAAEVRFALGAYDAARPLTIDPTVIFSTFTGSTADNWGFTATYDQAGNLYSGGIVFGPGYPTTAGSYSPVFNGTVGQGGNGLDCDMALIKFNPRASGPAARVWATYLGGNSSEFPHSLVTNRRGELVVLGTTSSTNFPTTAGAFDRVFNGGPSVSPYSPPPLVPGGPPPFVYGPPYDLPNGSDLVVSRLSAGGDSLLASTYLGGTDTDGLLSVQDAAPRLCHNYGDYFRGDVLLDAQDNVYLASATNSADFPRAAGSFGGPYHGGPTDGVVCSLTPRLGALRFSGLLGGSGADAAYSLQLDGQGGVYATGGTTSPDFPVTAGCLQAAPGGDVDAFVARISPDGRQISRASYLGGAAYDQAFFVQLDTQGEVYLLGQTLAPFAASPGRYTNPGGTQYVQKLSARLDSLRFRTVFGSGARDRSGPRAGLPNVNLSPTAFLVDQCNRVYISGWGGGENQNNRFGFANGHLGGMPLTANAAQAATDSADFYLAQFGPDMNRLQYATYLGSDGGEGDHVDGGTCRFDPRGFVYHAVCSCSNQGSGFPIPPGANTYTAIKANANCNNAAFKINFETVPITLAFDSVVCATAPPLPLRGRPTGGTWTGPGVSGSAATGFVFTPSLPLVGFQNLIYAVTGDSICGTSAPLRLRVAAPPAVAFAPLPAPRYCRGRATAPVPLTATPGGGVFSGPGVSGGSFSPVLAGPGAHVLTYTYQTPGLSCTPIVGTQTVEVVDSILVRLPADTLVCATAAPLPLRASPPGGTWAGPGVSAAGAGFVFTPSATLVGSQTLTYTAPNAGPCGGLGQQRIRVSLPPVVSFAALPQATYCRGRGTAAVPLTATPGGGSFSGPGVSGSSFSPVAAGPGPHVLSYAYQAPGSPCGAVVSTQTVLVVDSILVRLPADTLVCAAAGPLPLPAAPAGGTWAGPGVSGSVVAGYVFTPSAVLIGSQTLTYTAPNAGPCGGLGQRRVRVAAAPVVSFAALPQANYCRGRGTAAVPLTASPPGGIFSGPGVSGSSFSPAAAGPGAHVLTYTYQTPGLNCPPVVLTRPVLVTDSVLVRVASDTLVCADSGPLPLPAAPVGGTWAGPGVSGSPASGYVFTPSAMLNGLQTLTYTAPNAGPCGGLAQRRVRVDALVQAAIAPLPQNSTYCPNSAPLPLAASPPGGIFSGPGVGGSVAAGFVFTPGAAGPGTHQIDYRYASAAGCVALARATALVLAVPVVPLFADTVLCVAAAPLPLPTAPGDAWRGPGVRGSVAAGFVFDPATAGVGAQGLTFTAAAANRCGGTTGWRIAVVPVPVATVAALPPAVCVGAAPLPLAGLPAGGRFSGPGVRGSAATGFVFDPGRAGVGPHTLTYTYLAPGLSCPATATATALVTPVLPLTLPADTVLCPGSTAQIRLRAAPLGGTWAGAGVRGSTAAGFVFDARALPGSGRARLTYAPPASSCAAPASFGISTAPVPAFAPAYTAPRCPNVLAAPRQIAFADAANNAATRWDFGDGTPPATGATATHAYQQPGTYRPVASLPYGPANACTVQVALPPVEVVAQNIPNVITPNADRLNDTFSPVFACLPRLQIYSRWGRLVYESEEYANDWAAEGQAAGIYYYLLDDHHGQRLRGWLEVVR